MLRATLRLSAAALPLLLGGCIAFGAIDRRANTINDQVANAQSQGVLLNLARASRNEPIYFVAFNQLSASGTTEFRAGAPQFFLGPNLPAPDKIATFTGGSTFLDNSTNSNFQMSLLGSKDFWSGLMAPLDLRDVDLLLHQGYSRELIFYLVIAKATITPVAVPGKPALPPQVIYNDPGNPASFRLFEYYIREAMEHGLTTETFESADAPPASDEDDTTASGGKSGGKKPKPAARTSTEAELCYDRALVMPKDIGDIAPDSFCGAKGAVRSVTAGGAPLNVTLHDPSFPLHDVPLKIDVTTRSIYGVFYYLGAIIAHGDEARVHLRHYDLPSETTLDEPLLNVVTDGQGQGEKGPCFAAVSYEGASYCVPRDGADNTKRIFGILNALIALKQVPGDLPTTQTVRIEQ